MKRAKFWFALVATLGGAGALVLRPSVALAQDEGDDDGGGDDDGNGDAPLNPGPPTPPNPHPATPATPATPNPPGSLPETVPLDPSSLTCDGWRYPLTETRSVIGPARFAEESMTQRALALSSSALANCSQLKPDDPNKAMHGVCYGLVTLAGQFDTLATQVFSKESAACLLKPAKPGDSCERIREQTATMRRYDDLVMQRAELALAEQLCSQPKLLNSKVREDCGYLDQAFQTEAGTTANIGQFSLNAPLPDDVATIVDQLRTDTDGQFLSSGDNLRGVQSMCTIKQDADACSISGFSSGKPAPSADNMFTTEQQNVGWGMCQEFRLAECRTNTCRQADVYIDERGELHLNKALTTEEQRRDASLCVDVSDFDPENPLMVTVGLDPTGSVPDRIWPGETMQIGHLIDRPVTPEDILSIHVYGKARGISLAATLEVNGVVPNAQKGLRRHFAGARLEEACRIARSWVPVVDHEIPVGNPDRQVVIPIEYGRGRDGETRAIQEGDAVMIWARDIEPSGSVQALQSDGTFVGYEPPPLIGQSGGQSYDMNPTAGRRMPTELRAAGAAVQNTLVPRRSRYPGSRVLRLGHPSGNNSYQLTVCTGINPLAALPNAPTSAVPKAACVPSNVVLNEHLYVHGVYHFGVRAYFGFTWFGHGALVAQRTQQAIAAGSDVWQVEEQGRLGSEDLAVLLAFYPFGRDPYSFDYKFWSSRHGNYWDSFALLAGFTLRDAPWNDIYVGGSLPLANGLSLTVLANLALHDRPAGVSKGDLITGTNGQAPDLSQLGSQRQLDVGLSVGISLDFDLAERAFRTIWSKLSATPPENSASPGTESEYPEG
jgi:hypothetical protein